MKKYIIMAATLMLLFAGCEDTEHQRGHITQRGYEIYRAWNNEMYILQKLQEQTFALNKMLQAESESEAENIYSSYFEATGYEIRKPAENVYLLASEYGTEYNPFTLIVTDGNSLTSPGTEWSVVTNLPNNFVYAPTAQKTCPPDIEPQPEKISCGTKYLPFVIKCTAADTWTWKDANPNAETLDAFSIDWTVSRTIYEVIPGLVNSYRYIYSGKGRFLVNDKTAYIDYEMKEMKTHKENNILIWIGGTADLTATSTFDNKTVQTSIAANPKGKTITYCGITEKYGHL